MSRHGGSVNGRVKLIFEKRDLIINLLQFDYDKDAVELLERQSV